MQVRQRLADREGGLVRIELALEHHRNDVGGAARLVAGGQCFSQARRVVRAQLAGPLMRTAKQAAVRWQYENIGRQAFVQVLRVEKPFERIGFRLVGPDADVGRDARQQHVAGDHHVEFAAIQ